MPLTFYKLCIIQHENYDGNSLSTEGLPHDIALLQVSRPMVFNEYVTPACLPGDENLDLVGNGDCWITGWGLTQGQYIISVLIQKVRQTKSLDSSQLINT